MMQLRFIQCCCLLLATIAFPRGLAAQVKLINTALIDPDLNNIYIGIQNPIKVLNGTLTGYTLTGQKSTTREINGAFIVTPFREGADTLRLIHNGKTILQQVFYASYFPLPGAQLGKIASGSASIQDIIASPVLHSTAGNFNIDSKQPVTSFQLKIKRNHTDEENTVMVIPSNKLTDKEIAVIKLLSPGDKISFEDIKADFLTGNNRLPSFSITVE